MQHVYFKCTYEIIAMPDFFKKLREYVGEFRIEQQSIDESATGVVTISFSTDKVQIAEGKLRIVELIGEKNGMALNVNGHIFEDWCFTKIETL